MTATSSVPITRGATANPLTKFSDVHPRQAQWLWPNWLPLGRLAVLDGDPGLGKSTLLFDLAARVSKDGIMPDGSAGVSGGVIILNAEDDAVEVIQPRLVAAGADLERIFHLGEIDSGNGCRQARIPDDVPMLGRLIVDRGARLLIIDPMAAFLAGAEVSSDQHIRRVLRQVSAMAQEHGCTVVCVRHLNKGDSANAIYRGCGSIGVIGHARSGLLVALDPEDEEARILAVTKCNMARRPTSLRFAVEDHQGVSRIAWRGTASYQANHLVERPLNAGQRLRRQEARACEEFLRESLSGFAKPIQSIKAECGEAGFSLRTTERAAQSLGLVLTRKYGLNMWGMPGGGRRDEG